jgi:hypothetical protein
MYSSKGGKTCFCAQLVLAAGAGIFHELLENHKKNIERKKNFTCFSYEVALS